MFSAFIAGILESIALSWVYVGLFPFEQGLAKKSRVAVVAKELSPRKSRFMSPEASMLYIDRARTLMEQSITFDLEQNDRF